MKEPFTDVIFTYSRKKLARSDEVIAQDIFSGDFEWSARIGYPTKDGRLTIAKIKAEIPDVLNKKRLAPAEYTLTNDDIEKLRERNRARFIIAANEGAKKLTIRLEDKKQQEEKQAMEQSPGNGG